MANEPEGTNALNHYLQTRDKANLLSWDESQQGPRHEPTWTCICKIDGIEYGRGTGQSKQAARAAAAALALEKLVDAEAQTQTEAAATHDDGTTPDAE
ncbi:hypothetical protein DAEQUDRAFT_762733 [Daedalea quercina L-15889]|uniref:DRBM domain-containing protein n=1 Tax=Daedalea quercina L-15889 TaxID=1314783 RepID=A0A165T4Y4_9APHY|nr:hypothetical protein DAEQUDRAFT_762733 [Daedalea quercina L-15889]